MKFKYRQILDIGLKDAFLKVHFLGLAVIFVLLYFAAPKILVQFSTDVEIYKTFVFFPLIILAYIYVLLSLLLIWHATNKQKNKFYFYAARIYVVIIFVLNGLKFLK